MWSKMIRRWFRNSGLRRASARPRSFTPNLEALGERLVPTVTAFFVPRGGLLSVLGDAADNAITVSRDAAGTILVNGGAVRALGGTPTVFNTKQITAFGLSGNDTIALDETNGALPAAELFGGDGNDVLTGGSGNDLLFGQAGNDFLFGGAGDDVLIGGTGNDQVFGEAGNDRMIWNNGDNTDLNEGGTGSDTVEVNGSNAADIFIVAANGARVRFDRTNLVPFSLDIGTTENLVVNMSGGDDSFTAGNGLAPLIALTVDGGAGNDTIIGGDGNDLIVGGRGSDVALMGAGDNTFVWNPGEAAIPSRARTATTR